jgi:hypothetical protein
MDFQSPPPAGGFGAGPGPGHFGPLHEPSPPVASSDALAVASLVLGVLSIPFTFCCFGGLPLGLAALFIGRQAQTKIRAHPHLFHGARSATAGFWLGAVGVGLSVLYFGLQLAFAFIAR